MSLPVVFIHSETQINYSSKLTTWIHSIQTSSTCFQSSETILETYTVLQFLKILFLCSILLWEGNAAAVSQNKMKSRVLLCHAPNLITGVPLSMARAWSTVYELPLPLVTARCTKTNREKNLFSSTLGNDTLRGKLTLKESIHSTSLPLDSINLLIPSRLDKNPFLTNWPSSSS